MTIKELVGARIKELRKALGETQEAIAFKAGVDKTYWNEVENGKRNVSVMNLNKIINALGTNPAIFFNSKTFAKSIPNSEISKSRIANSKSSKKKN
jgi:transcriptional regulator with XRE-family HTH domain